MSVKIGIKVGKLIKYLFGASNIDCFFCTSQYIFGTIKAKIPRAFMETVSQIERLPALTLTSVVTGLEDAFVGQRYLSAIIHVY